MEEWKTWTCSVVLDPQYEVMAERIAGSLHDYFLLLDPLPETDSRSRTLREDRSIYAHLLLHPSASDRYELYFEFMLGSIEHELCDFEPISSVLPLLDVLRKELMTRTNDPLHELSEFEWSDHVDRLTVKMIYERGHSFQRAPSWHKDGCRSVTINYSNRQDWSTLLYPVPSRSNPGVYTLQKYIDKSPHYEAHSSPMPHNVLLNAMTMIHRSPSTPPECRISDWRLIFIFRESA